MRLAIITGSAVALSTCGLATMFVYTLHVPTKPQLFVADFRPSAWTTTVRKTDVENEKSSGSKVANLEVQVINFHAP